MSNIWWEMASSFLKIGAFTFGGGYAMIPLVEREVVTNKKWISSDEFVDLIALAQAAPGILAVNMAIFCGYKVKGVKGAVLTSFSCILPSFCIILLIATVFKDYQQYPTVESIFKGIRPAVVSLLVTPVFKMAQATKLSWKLWWIPTLIAVLIAEFGVSPLLFIPLAGVAGWIWGHYQETRKGDAV